MKKPSERAEYTNYHSHAGTEICFYLSYVFLQIGCTALTTVGLIPLRNRNRFCIKVDGWTFPVDRLPIGWAGPRSSRHSVNSTRVDGRRSSRRVHICLCDVIGRVKRRAQIWRELWIVHRAAESRCNTPCLDVHCEWWENLYFVKHCARSDSPDPSDLQASTSFI